MSDDRDAIPDAEAPATDSERHRARAFAELIDGMVAGDAAPPALVADQRELLELAASLRSQVRDEPLADTRRDQLIDDAFRAAVGAEAQPAAEPAPVASLAERRSRARVLAPWIGTAIAAAAAIVLLVTRPAPETRTVVNEVERPVLGAEHLSRPSDALIGKIDARDAADATSRIDMIYADRLVGYRDLSLRGLAKGATP